LIVFDCFTKKLIIKNHKVKVNKSVQVDYFKKLNAAANQIIAKVAIQFTF